MLSAGYELNLAMLGAAGYNARHISLIKWEVMQMKKIVIACATALLVAGAAGSALAESIKGTMGVTGRLGVIVPADSKEAANNGSGRNYLIETDPGFNGGAGFIYGMDDTLALEIGVDYSTFHTDVGDADMKDVAVGVQYRFPPANPKLVPYMGFGLDVLIPGLKNRQVDTVLGGHFRGGFDYFFDRAIALNLDFKATGGMKADIDQLGGKIGEFNPSNITGTAGIRVFFR